MITRLPVSLRWGLCFSVALGLHAAGAAALIARWNDDADTAASAPVIMIDLAPVAVAPTTTPSDAPPDQVTSKQINDPDPVPEKPPELVEPAPEPEPEKPVEKVEEIKPAPEPELAMLPPVKPPIEKPPEKKKEAKKKPRHHMASIDRAATSADKKAERAAAPTPGASGHNPQAISNWKSQLVGKLERSKRYPSEARSRGDHGVVQVAFSVDRSGVVHRARIARSSGSQLLDHETLSMLERASPLPPPPADMPGSLIPIVVPIRYNIAR